ncbi:MAG: tetratricopeptide repeat protein [Bacteroidota bacterium]
MAPLMQAQTSQLDSLAHLLKTASEDTNKVNLLNQIAVKYWTLDPSRSVEFAGEALALAQQLGFRFGQAKAYGNRGVAFFYLALLDSSEKDQQRALDIYVSLKNKKGMASAYNNLGLVSRSRGDYDQAIEYYLQSLKLREDINDLPGEGSALVNIGNVYYNKATLTNNIELMNQAQSYYQQALELFEKLGDRLTVATCLSNIGNTSLVIAMSERDTAGYSKSLDYLLRALDIRKAAGDMAGIALTLNNIGNVYQQMGKNEVALSMFLESVKIHEQTGNKMEVAGIGLNIARLYFEKMDYASCIAMTQQTLSTATGIGAREIIKECYKGLADAYGAQKNFEKAYLFYQKYTGLKDTLLNEKNSMQVNELQEKYNTEKKDKELLRKDAQLARSDADAQRASLQRNGFIAGFFVMLLLAFFIYRGYREKQKANEVITRQKALVEEKQREILDSIHYARRIQQSLLPSEKYIGRALSRHDIKNP